jgi:hypothetical protein
MITELSSYILVREARIELFKYEKACVAKSKRKREFSSLGLFVSFWTDAKKKAPLWDFSNKLDSLRNGEIITL